MSGKRISREKLTIKKMIDLYQAKCPQASAEPEHYEALFVYAQKRLDKCVFGEEKPACKQCPVHCYQPAKREEMKQIMRWAGPRMLWRHPILTVRHINGDYRSRFCHAGETGVCAGAETTQMAESGVSGAGLAVRGECVAVPPDGAG